MGLLGGNVAEGFQRHVLQQPIAPLNPTDIDVLNDVTVVFVQSEGATRAVKFATTQGGHKLVGVEGRAARREEMKRHSVREVDPSEFRRSPPVEPAWVADWRADRGIVRDKP